MGAWGGRHRESSAYDTMDNEKQQHWRPARSPQRSIVRGRRGLITVTTLLLVAVIYFTTAAFKPNYAHRATHGVHMIGGKASAYIQKWRESASKEMGHWKDYEEQNFPTTNPQMVPATTESYSSGLTEAHPGRLDSDSIMNKLGDTANQAPKDEDKSSSEPTESTLHPNAGALSGVAAYQDDVVKVAADGWEAPKADVRDSRIADSVAS